jgi:hypothetical protein
MEFRLEVDVLADGAPQQRQHALHDLAKRKPLRPERLPASESEKLLGEMRAALGRLKSAGGEAPLVRVGQLLGQHSVLPITTVSRLLKSCATPPVSWPTASIF